MHFNLRRLGEEKPIYSQTTHQSFEGGFFFFSSVLFFSFLRQAHFSSLSRTAAGGGIITLHYITEHSIMGLNPTAFKLVAVSIADRQGFTLQSPESS